MASKANKCDPTSILRFYFFAMASLPSSGILPENALCEKLMDALNNTALGMGIAIGDYVGLFEAMSKLDEPTTSIEIAEQASLNER